jgi:hypothetical protein
MTRRLYGAGSDRRESVFDRVLVGTGRPDDRRILVHAHIRGRFELAQGSRPPGHGRSGPRRGDRGGPSRGGLANLAGAIGALGLLAAACGGSSEASPSEPDPTFSREDNGSFVFPEPVATVSQLLPPRGDNPWTVVGSVFDPESTTSMAATWRSDDGRSWEREDLAPADGDVSESFAAAADNDDGRYAVGWSGDGALSDAAVWLQSGGEWDRLETPEMGGEHEQWAFDVAASGSGVVVAGGESVWGEVRARLWFSADGETWEAVDGGPGGPFDATGQESIRKIAAFGDGFVAVGSRNLDSEQDGIVWYSPDGREWEQLSAPTLGGPGRQAALTVAAAGDVLVAGGYTTDGNGQGQPVVWRSRDGRSWGPASLPLAVHDDNRSAAADLAVRTLTVDESGIVAGGGSDWRPAIWRSRDGGTSWELLPNPVERGLFQDGVALTGAATHGDATLALGLEPTVMRLEGDRWQDATGDEFPKGGNQPFATSIAIGEEETILGGGLYHAPEGDNRERYVGQVWRGDGWEPIDGDRITAGQFMDVTAFSGGFVGVGLEDFAQAERRTAGMNDSPDGLIWSSADGVEWSRVSARIPEISEELLPVLAENEDEALPSVIAQTAADQPFETAPPAGGRGTQSLDAVAPLGDGFIAVGVSYNDSQVEPIVVTSGDGETIRGEDAGFTGNGTQRFRDVCVSPDGVAVAVGVRGVDGAYDAAARVRDAQGAWSAGEADDDSFGGAGSQQAYGCAASEDGFIMVGADDRSGDSDARLWTSEDGRSWSRVESGMLGGAGDQWASAVTAVPSDSDGGWLVGGTDTVAGDGDVALWRVHADGSVSRRDRGEPDLAGPGEQSVNAIAVADGDIVVVGDDYGRVGVWRSGTIDR